MLEGMLWVMRSAGAWRDLPLHFGPWQSVYSRYQTWAHEGLWHRILALLHPDETDLLFET